MAAPSDDAAASPDPLAFALELVPPVEFAFAYGSEVFRQGGHPGGGMVDYVFAVRDPARWHEANLRRNACHYSFIKHGGPRFVAAVQDQIPAFVYYNTLVRPRLQASRSTLIPPCRWTRRDPWGQRASNMV